MPHEPIGRLIARSSLGSPAARRLRARTDPQVVADIRLRTMTERHLAMSNDNNRHVVPNPDGGWDVKAPGAKRASTHHDTQAEAERRAKEIVGNNGGGEVRIHGRDGRIRDSDTVAPGNDPFPPRDTKH